MSQPKDLSPKLSLQSAEVELASPYVEPPIGQLVGGLSTFSNSFKRGSGNKVFGSDANGIWLGAADWEGAPFSVDMEGNVIATSLDLSAYVTKADTDQNLTGSVNVGAGNIKIDGANKRIIINDGTNDRVLLGYLASGF